MATGKKKEVGAIPAGLKVKVTAELPAKWEPKEGDVLSGVITTIQTVEAQGKEGVREAQVMHVKTERGSVGLWESATLRPLFKDAAEGRTVWVRYEGLGEKKPGRDAPKLYTAGFIE